ncbi:MAG: hypothetical protein Q7K39_04185 [Candidatus Magasanikbacteria bacterium]|nr:hypothetical protein [Candidatus Magasanikbacteria bacterium]
MASPESGHGGGGHGKEKKKPRRSILEGPPVRDSVDSMREQIENVDNPDYPRKPKPPEDWTVPYHRKYRRAGIFGTLLAGAMAIGYPIYKELNPDRAPRIGAKPSPGGSDKNKSPASEQPRGSASTPSQAAPERFNEAIAADDARVAEEEANHKAAEEAEVAPVAAPDAGEAPATAAATTEAEEPSAPVVSAEPAVTEESGEEENTGVSGLTDASGRYRLKINVPGLPAGYNLNFNRAPGPAIAANANTLEVAAVKEKPLGPEVIPIDLAPTETLATQMVAGEPVQVLAGRYSREEITRALNHARILEQRIMAAKDLRSEYAPNPAGARAAAQKLKQTKEELAAFRLGLLRGEEVSFAERDLREIGPGVYHEAVKAELREAIDATVGQAMIAKKDSGKSLTEILPVGSGDAHTKPEPLVVRIVREGEATRVEVPADSFTLAQYAALFDAPERFVHSGLFKAKIDFEKPAGVAPDKRAAWQREAKRELPRATVLKKVLGQTPVGTQAYEAVKAELQAVVVRLTTSFGARPADLFDSKLLDRLDIVWEDKK